MMIEKKILRCFVIQFAMKKDGENSPLSLPVRRNNLPKVIHHFQDFLEYLIPVHLHSKLLDKACKEGKFDVVEIAISKL